MLILRVFKEKWTLGQPVVFKAHIDAENGEWRGMLFGVIMLWTRINNTIAISGKWKELDVRATNNKSDPHYHRRWSWMVRTKFVELMYREAVFVTGVYYYQNRGRIMNNTEIRGRLNGLLAVLVFMHECCVIQLERKIFSKYFSSVNEMHYTATQSQQPETKESSHSVFIVWQNQCKSIY